MLALLGRPASLTLLSQVCGLAADQVRTALDRPLDSGLITGEPPLGPYCARPSVDEWLRTTVRPDLRRLQLRIAETLLADTSLSQRLDEGVRHLLAAGVSGDRGARACLAAAVRHEGESTFSAALELALQGLDAGSAGPGVQLGLLRVLGRCQARLGQVEAACQSLEAAVRLARDQDDPMAFATTVVDLTCASQSLLDTDPQYQLWIQEALEASGDAPATQAVLLARLAMADYFQDLASSRALASQAWELAAATDDSMAHEVCFDAWAFTSIGTPSWRDVLERSKGGRLRVTRRSPVIGILHLAQAVQAGDRAEVHHRLAQLESMPPSFNRARCSGLVDVERLCLAHLDGNREEGTRLRQLLLASTLPVVHLMLLGTDLIWALLSAELAPTSPPAAVLGLPSSDLTRQFWCGRAAIRAHYGDTAALAELRHIAAARGPLLNPTSDVSHDPNAAILALTGWLLEDNELCQAALRQSPDPDDHFVTLAVHLPLGPIGWFRAWAHVQLGALPRALAANDHALVASRRLGSAVWEVHCVLQRAHLLERHDAAASAHHARMALDGARRLGLPRLAEFAQLRAASPDSAGRLADPRHRQILELAASNLTNEQIARRLYVSVSTVERHLTHIYRTLGVKNRADAVATLIKDQPASTDTSTHRQQA